LIIAGTEDVAVPAANSLILVQHEEVKRCLACPD
jgi:hypothetical protein